MWEGDFAVGKTKGELTDIVRDQTSTLSRVFFNLAIRRLKYFNFCSLNKLEKLDTESTCKYTFNHFISTLVIYCKTKVKYKTNGLDKNELYNEVIDN